MPAYSFKERFVPFVIDGSKRQTIRKRRKHPAKVGDTLYHYYGLRTKQCRKLREDICLKVEEVIIVLDELKNMQIYVDGIKLTGIERDEFAWSDGFRHEHYLNVTLGCWAIMCKWFYTTHEFPFVGDVIYW